MRLVPGFFRIMLIILISGYMFSACGGTSKPKDPELIQKARNLAAQGSYWYNRGCYARAEQHFFQAMETSRLLDDTFMVLRARNNLGAANLAMKRYKMAGEHLHKALELNRIVKDPDQESLILGNLASLAFRTDNAQEAERLWRRAVEVAEAAPNQPGLGLHLNNLGMLFRTTGRLDEAETLLNRAMKLAAGKISLRAGVHHQLGLLASARSNLELALEHFKTALDLDKAGENPFGVAADLEQLGYTYQAMKDFDNAAAELDRAIFLRASLDEDEKVKDLYQALKKNKSQGNRPESMAPYDHLLKRIEEGQMESILCR